MFCKTCLKKKVTTEKRFKILAALLIAELSYFFATQEISGASLVVGLGMAGAGGINTEVISNISGNQLIVEHSTTIGDYTTPTTMTASSGATLTPDFTEAFASDTWTNVGTGLSITSGVARASGMANNADNRKYKALGFTLAGTWTLDFDFKYTTDLGSAYPICFTAGTSDPNNTAQDMLGVYFNGTGLASMYKDGAGAVSGGTSIALTSGTQYYGVASQTSSTNIRIRIYSDAVRTVQVGSTQNQTIPSTVTGLTTCQLANNNNASADTTTWDVDNIKIYDGIVDSNVIPASRMNDGNTVTFHQTTSEINPNYEIDMGSSQHLLEIAIHSHANTTVTQIKIQYWNVAAWVDLRLVLVSALTHGGWNYIRFNGVTAQKLRIYGTDAGAKVLAANEIKVMTKTDSELLAQHGHFAIANDDNTLGLDGT